jgi:hypothetical protein
LKPARGPLLGYNNNIPHHGKMYHVQTEDSGARRPHVITHLFADGGRIVHSTKTSYAEMVDDPEVVEKVRQLMKDQHRAMADALRLGQLDHLLEEGPPARRPSKPPRASKPPAARSPSKPPASRPPPKSKPPSRPPRAARATDPKGPASRRSKPPVAIDAPSNVEEAPSSYRRIGQSRRRTNPEPHALQRLASASESDAPPQTTRMQESPTIPTSPPLPRIEAASGRFGERYTSGRRFDQLVLEFLRRRG